MSALVFTNCYNKILKTIFIVNERGILKQNYFYSYLKNVFQP